MLGWLWLNKIRLVKGKDKCVLLRNKIVLLRNCGLKLGL
jgi:hypothetical protein